MLEVFVSLSADKLVWRIVIDSDLGYVEVKFNQFQI